MKFLKTTFITILLFSVIWVYVNVYMDTPKRNKQLFIKYLSNNINLLEDWYLNLEELEPQHEEILEKIPNELKVLDTRTFLRKLNETETFRDKYLQKFAEIINESECTVNEFIEVELNNEIELADRYKLEINEKLLITKITSIAKEILGDEEFIKISENIFTKEQIKNLKNLNDKFIKDIEKTNKDAKLRLDIYLKSGKTVRADLINSAGQISYQIENVDNKNILKFSVK